MPTSGRGNGHQEILTLGFGSTLFRYARTLPQRRRSDLRRTTSPPARALLYCYITRLYARLSGRVESELTVAKRLLTGTSSSYKYRARSCFKECKRQARCRCGLAFPGCWRGTDTAVRALLTAETSRMGFGTKNSAPASSRILGLAGWENFEADHRSDDRLPQSGFLRRRPKPSSM